MVHLVLNGAQVSCERNVPASGRHSVYSRPSDITATKVHRPAKVIVKSCQPISVTNEMMHIDPRSTTAVRALCVFVVD